MYQNAFLRKMSWENSITVTLHNDSTESLYTGDIVTGIITLDIKKDLKIDSISMEIIGICKAQWTRFTPAIPYLKIYTENKKVLFVKQNDLFVEGFQMDKSLRAGTHCYPFHFALPPDLPSTFKSSIASVNYYVKIKSKPACKLKTSVPFIVLANVNLNNDDDMLNTHAYEFKKKISKTAEVVVNFRTYKGFASRQIIPFEVTLINDKQVKIRKICVTLIQKLRYTVSSGYADDTINIHAVNYNSIENTKTEVCNLVMEIPQIVPSSINSTAPMIKISYELKVEVFFSYHPNLIECIPVTVAAVPVIHYDF